MIKKVILITAIVWSCINTASINAQQAATTAQKTIALQHGAHGVGRRRDAAMEKWRAYGLGQFVHWGLYSIPAGEWNGKQYNGAAEWIKSWKEVPATTYDSLMYQFNPTKFNAESWAATAKQME
nr:alpha-L-fucosidase [Mucilaginibacter gossypii]